LLTFVWLIWEFAPSPRAQRWLMWAFVLGNSLVLAATYMQFLLGDAAPGGRYTAAETNPNAVAIDAVFAICFILYGMNTLSRGVRIASWGYILAAGLAALLTSSRAAIGALAVCILLNLAGFRRIGWGQAFAILFCLFCGWLLVPQAAVELLTSRLEESERARGLEVRQEAWIAGLRTWETNPLLGVGAGSYPTASEQGGGPSLVAHNTLINVLVEDGVVGLGIFLFMCLMFLRLVWHMPLRERGFWIALLGAYGEYCLFASQEYQKATWLIFALILVQSEAFRRPKGLASAAACQGRMTAAGTAPLGKRDAG
jgi:O-antigen ligase